MGIFNPLDEEDVYGLYTFAFYGVNPNISKGYKMTEAQYHKQLEDAEKNFNKKYGEEMEHISSLIDDAYVELEKAMSVYLRSDVLCDSMDYNEFKAYIVSEIKDYL